MRDFHGNFETDFSVLIDEKDNNRTSTDELLPNMSRRPITVSRSPLSANDRRVNNEMTIAAVRGEGWAYTKRSSTCGVHLD